MEPSNKPLSDRAREKADSREADQNALREGKPFEELREENAHFARLNVSYLRGRRPLA